MMALETEGAKTTYSRRAILLALPPMILAACVPPSLEETEDWKREYSWQAHFPDLSGPSILVDTAARRLAFWAKDDALYLEYPIGVPSAPELVRRGRTEVVRKAVDPSWAPTPSMLARNPSLPRFVGPGPDNPLGTHALYLGWKYYAIHGTNDPTTIGRPSTSGCIRLFDGHIAALYGVAPITTRVRVV